MDRIEWHGLYAESWGNDLVPEAYAHPAKYSRGLIRQIYAYMLAESMIAPGDVIGDPFGGQAGGALDAMINGLHWRGVELEPRFCKLGQGHDCPGFTKADWRRLQGRLTRVVDLCPVCLLKYDVKNMAINASRVIPEQEAHHYTGNIELWNGRYAPHFERWGTAVLVQGDSRNFAAIVGGLSGAISSPPYANSVNKESNGIDVAKFSGRDKNRNFGDGNSNIENAMHYGQTPGQLGSMPPGDLDAAISSPPYGDAINATTSGIDWGKAGRPDRLKPSPNRNNTMTDGVTSYGRSPGQVGRLDGCVSSPPYESAINNHTPDDPDNPRLSESAKSRLSKMDLTGRNYGSTPGNTGNATGETFWTASREIVAQTYAALKPGGYAAWVCGDFVRKGKRVRFGEQWLALCEACGFEPVTWAIAWKTERHGTQTSLFGDVEMRTDRVSFFRRLANEKNPDAAVLNEDVIFVRRPL